MPNHVSSICTITGPIDDVLRFVNAVKSADSNFDFNALVPMPEELRNTRSPVLIQTQAEIDALWAEYNQKRDAGTLEPWQIVEGKPFGLGITQEANDALRAKYGASNWYDWALNEWGTKWGAYDTGEWDINEAGGGIGVATISYNTAWSPANAFYENVSEQFPTLVFETRYADEGGGFVCETSYQDGEVIEDTSYGWDSDEGIAVREDVGYGPDPDEQMLDDETVDA